VAAIIQKGRTQLFVAPVTHSKPERGGDAIEIPENVKAQLGLDRDRSWIVATELNRFIWPGPDIRIVPGHDSPTYDLLPDWLFIRVRDAILRHARAGPLKVTKRTE
jgi:hypothetical protein